MVRFALRRPYTIAALVILVCLLGVLAALRMPTDIFPEINIPVVSVVWTYSGMSAPEIQNRILALHERQLREAGTPQSANPDVARELLPYERQQLSSESQTVLRLAPPIEGALPDVFAKPLPLPGGPRPGVEPMAPPVVCG